MALDWHDVRIKNRTMHTDLGNALFMEFCLMPKMKRAIRAARSGHVTVS